MKKFMKFLKKFSIALIVVALGLTAIIFPLIKAEEVWESSYDAIIPFICAAFIYCVIIIWLSVNGARAIWKILN
jgi:ABC-type amino acid transport system permease subunit